MKIVSSLEARRKESLKLMEELPDRLVPERMWLVSLKADADKVTIQGVAFDNPTIADFMRNLEGSALFSGIDLKQSKGQKFNTVTLKSFELVCKRQKPGAPVKGKKKKG